MTVRNGRSVIPLHVSDKRALSGIIHDESTSGQTVFIEPYSTDLKTYSVFKRSDKIAGFTKFECEICKTPFPKIIRT